MTHSQLKGNFTGFGGILVAEFLTTKGTSHQIDQIIMNAKEQLVLVSPYLSISKYLLERLQDADRQGVEITLIYGKEKLKPEEMQKLQDLPRLSLYYHGELHAKCFYNENDLIITSMNLHEFSEKANREMGVLVKRGEDNNLYNEAIKEVQSIRGSAEEIRHVSPSGCAAAGKAVMGLAGALADSLTGTPNKGYCIRCAQAIEFDPKRPYCAECYAIWAEYKKKTYTEKFCHQCGKHNKGSMSKPLCRVCY
jgi:hypothetical protein